MEITECWLFGVGDANGNRRHLKSGGADGWCFVGTERVHHPGHEGQDQAWPQGVLEEIEDVEKADLRGVAQPVQGAQQPHGQHKAGYLLAMSQVCPPYLGIAGRVQGDAQTQGSPRVAAQGGKGPAIHVHPLRPLTPLGGQADGPMGRRVFARKDSPQSMRTMLLWGLPPCSAVTPGESVFVKRNVSPFSYSKPGTYQG